MSNSKSENTLCYHRSTTVTKGTGEQCNRCDKWLEPPQDTSLDDQNKYWQSQFRDILGDNNALDVGYAIPYLFAQIAPLPKTRNEHDRQTRKINALAFAIDDYVAQQQAKLLQVIEDEVIGNYTQGVIRTGGIVDWKKEQIRNSMKKEQRQILKQIKERYE